MFAGGHSAGDVALLCAPLALLAGCAVERLAASWQERPSWRRDGVLALIVLLLGGLCGAAGFLLRPRALSEPAAIGTVLVVLAAGGGAACSFERLFSGLVGGTRHLARRGDGAGACLACQFLFRLDWAQLSTPERPKRTARPDRLRRGDARCAGGNGRPVLSRTGSAGGDARARRRESRPGVALVSARPGGCHFCRATSIQMWRRRWCSARRSEPDPAQGSGWNPSERYIGQDFVTRTWWQPSELLANDRLPGGCIARASASRCPSSEWCFGYRPRKAASSAQPRRIGSTPGILE